MALAHHDAAGRDQRAGGEAELVGAQKRADNDVAAGAKTAVDLQRDARAKPVEHQRLLSLGQTHLPGRAGMLDRGQRRSAGAAVIARDDDVVGARLGDAGRHRPTPTSETSFTEMSAAGFTFFRFEDQLRQSLDRVDVVVRRRRDQAYAGVEWRVLRSSRPPCGRAAGRPRRAWRPARP